MPLTTLRQSAVFHLDEDVVAGCLDLRSARDVLFEKAWRAGPASLTRRDRCAIAGTTGHVAESVTELLLGPLGWLVLWHFAGPGGHGADLVFLAPGDTVVVVEVKGTVVPGCIPRLSRRSVAQMSAEWIDKKDNPAMAELGLDRADVYGGVVALNFADTSWRMAFTADFMDLVPITDKEQLAGLGWLKNS